MFIRNAAPQINDLYLCVYTFTRCLPIMPTATNSAPPSYPSSAMNDGEQWSHIRTSHVCINTSFHCVFSVMVSCSWGIFALLGYVSNAWMWRYIDVFHHRQTANIALALLSPAMSYSLHSSMLLKRGGMNAFFDSKPKPPVRTMNGEAYIGGWRRAINTWIFGIFSQRLAIFLRWFVLFTTCL